MWIVTITLKSTPHQIVMRFKTEESMKSASEPDKIAQGSVSDDFGQTAFWKIGDLAHVVTVDAATYWKGHNAETLAKMRAQWELKRTVQQDPDLEFIVSERGPYFGR